MTLTRDSVLWVVLFYIGLVAMALSTLTNPAEYGIPLSWMPYIKLVAFIATVVGGKLGLSWLPASSSAGTIARKPMWLLPLLLIPAVGTSACAGTLRDRVRTSALASGELVLSLDSEEAALYQAGAYAEAKHKAAGETIDTLIVAVRAFERAARAWPETMPEMPQNVSAAQEDVKKAAAAVAHIFEGVPGTGGLTKILDAIRARVGA